MNEAHSDAEVIGEVLGGDPQAFQLLVKRYERQIYTLCLRMVRSVEDAEDCAQTTFLKAYSQLSRFQTGRLFKSWLYRIATNVCIDSMRRAKVQPTALSHSDEVPEVLPDPNPGPRKAAALSEQRQAIRQALDSLDDKYRFPLVLFYLEGLECSEIAAMLRIPLATTKTRMRRGRLMLREIISKRWPQFALEGVEPL